VDIGFFLKQFISFFVEPLGMVLGLLAGGIYFLFKKKESYAKFFTSLAFILLFLFSYPPFSNFLVQNLENKYKKFDYKTKVKYIHVLGSGHNTDTTQPLSSQIGNSSIKRDLEGILIYKKIKGSKIIFTGYAGHTDTPNALMNARFAKALGVKDEDMIVNPKPKDTKEEALFTKSVVGSEPFVLVTSATHMPRAMMLFKSLGMNPIPAPTDFHKEKIDTYFRKPKVSYFFNSKRAMHEYIGILWVKLEMLI